MATRLVCSDEATIYLREKVNSQTYGSVVVIIVAKSSSLNRTSQSDVFRTVSRQTICVSFVSVEKSINGNNYLDMLINWDMQLTLCI